MPITQEGVTGCQVWCLYEIGRRIVFSKQYSYVTNHLHLCVTNEYIFVFTVTLLLLLVYLSLVNANTLLNITFTTIFICHQISTCPRDLFLNDLACQIQHLKITICHLYVCLYHFVHNRIINTCVSYMAHICTCIPRICTSNVGYIWHVHQIWCA